MLALELKVYRSGQIVIAEIDVNNPPEKEDHRPIVAMVVRSAFIISYWVGCIEAPQISREESSDDLLLALI